MKPPVTKLEHTQFAILVCDSCFRLVKNMSCFSLLVLKGMYHYWNYFNLFQGTKTQMGLPKAAMAVQLVTRRTGAVVLDSGRRGPGASVMCGS